MRGKPSDYMGPKFLMPSEELGKHLRKKNHAQNRIRATQRPRTALSANTSLPRLQIDETLIRSRDSAGVRLWFVLGIYKKRSKGAGYRVSAHKSVYGRIPDPKETTEHHYKPSQGRGGTKEPIVNRSNTFPVVHPPGLEPGTH